MSFTYCPECGNKQTVHKQNDSNYECTSCGWHFWNNAKAAVAVIILRGDGTFLASKRGREPAKGKFDAPGGFVDYYEDPADAAAREIREETSLVVNNPVLVSAYAFEYLPNNKPPVSTVDLVYVVTEWEGDPTPGDDSEELIWKPLEFMDSEEFAPNYPGLSAKLQTLQD